MMRILTVTTLCLLAVFNVSQVNPLPQKSRKPRKFIIDTDAGSDDAVGILLALNYEAVHKKHIEIIAITCTYGNTKKENVEINVLKILTIAKRNNIPVYGGAERSLIRDFEGDLFFGNDGLGDFEFKEKIIAEVDKSKYAALALIDLVKSHPGKVSIIAIGPLTNLALAIRLDSTFIQNADEIIIMGSSVAGLGNKEPNVEFNFAADPESNFIVMNSTRKLVTLVPWETVVNAQAGKEWREKVFSKLNSSAVHFLNKAEAKSLLKGRFWTAVDAVTIALAIWPNMIKKFLITNVTPVYDGAAMGSVLVDYNNRTGKPHNAKIVQSYNLELFKEKLLKYFSA